MKRLMCLSVLMVGLSGCAPMQIDFSLYESNSYAIPYDGVNSNAVSVIKDQSGRSYGNNNKVYVNQSMVLWKSPITNSSNSVPITLPLMGL